MVTSINKILSFRPLSTVFQRREEIQLHRFAELPEDIRVEIWIYAFAEAHVPAALWRYHRSEQPYRFFGRAEPTEVLDIAMSCKEARRIMERCFTPIRLHQRSYSNDIASLAHGAIKWVSGNWSPWLASQAVSTAPFGVLPVDLTSSYFIIHFNNMDMLYYIDLASNGSSPASEYIQDRVPVEVCYQIRVLWFHFQHFRFVSQSVSALLDRCPNLQRLELTKFELHSKEEETLATLRKYMPGWKIREFHERGFPINIVECTREKDGRLVYITSILWELRSDEEESGALEKFVGQGLFRKRPNGGLYSPCSKFVAPQGFWEWYFDPFIPEMSKIPNVGLHQSTFGDGSSQHSSNLELRTL